jgi:DNA-binding GntR family transcriptional regulator
VNISIPKAPGLETVKEPFMFPLSDAEKRAAWVKLFRIRYINDHPIFYDIHYLPNININRFTSGRFENKSLFDIPRVHFGMDIIGGE